MTLVDELDKLSTNLTDRIDKIVLKYAIPKRINLFHQITRNLLSPIQNAKYYAGSGNSEEIKRIFFKDAFVLLYYLDTVENSKEFRKDQKVLSDEHMLGTNIHDYVFTNYEKYFNPSKHPKVKP